MATLPDTSRVPRRGNFQSNSKEYGLKPRNQISRECQGPMEELWSVDEIEDAKSPLRPLGDLHDAKNKRKLGGDRTRGLVLFR